MSEDNITWNEMVTFMTDEVAEHVEEIDHDYQNHGLRELADMATVPLKLSIDNDFVSAHTDDDTTESFEHELEGALVEVLFAIGTIAYEYDVDIEDAFKQRREIMKSVSDFREATADADSEAAIRAAMDEHLTDEMQAAMDMQMGMGVDVGENVDDDEYDHDGTDRSYA